MTTPAPIPEAQHSRSAIGFRPHRIDGKPGDGDSISAQDLVENPGPSHSPEYNRRPLVSPVLLCLNALGL